MENTNWVGVDTHKDTLACYRGNSFQEFKTTPQGFEKALKWAGDANWAIEGAYCFGKPFANYLIKNNCKVYEINPYITKSWRAALSVNGNKNNFGDAKVISIFSKELKLKEISLKTIELKERISARELIVKQRTKLINSIKMLSYTRGIELKLNKLTTKRAEQYLKDFDDVIISEFGGIIKKLNQTISVLDKEIDELLPEKVLDLTKICGISKLSAAILYTETKGKLTTPAALANYCAVAPIENSSGKSAKHATNRHGNRKLNSVFFRISMCQSIHDERGKIYYHKKISEGKTPRQGRKCLSRQLVNSIFKILKNV